MLLLCIKNNTKINVHNLGVPSTRQPYNTFPLYLNTINLNQDYPAYAIKGKWLKLAINEDHNREV